MIDREQLEKANERLKTARSEVARRDDTLRREKQQSISFKPETLDLAKLREAEGAIDAPPVQTHDRWLSDQPVPAKDHENGIMPQTMANVHDVTRVSVSVDIRHLPLGFSEDPRRFCLSAWVGTPFGEADRSEPALGIVRCWWW